jgi:hypothetical protein
MVKRRCREVLKDEEVMEIPWLRRRHAQDKRWQDDDNTFSFSARAKRTTMRGNKIPTVREREKKKRETKGRGKINIRIRIACLS